MSRVQGNSVSLGQIAGHEESLTLPPDARAKHLYVCGATGTGKSKFLEHMIRQDIRNWPKSGCGLMMLDPHGSLYDSVMRWVAGSDFRRWPIIPIDLRKSERVVSYNLLRRRKDGDPAVVISAFVRAMLHAWGQSDIDDTPRLAKWLEAILFPLYEQQHTLAEALHLVSSPDLRRSMTAKVENSMARAVWESSRQLREPQFQEQVESTVNRIRKFLRTQVMRAMLCQAGATLDLGDVLDRGAIVLVNLASEGAQIDEEDGATLGSLLLSDLWTAAKIRGKRQTVKPFYLYLDEFQKFVTPSIAESLDQARGFGLHLTLAHQFPRQLTARGDAGRMLFDSVMANARSKVVFQLEHEEDLKLLAMWLARQEIDPDKIKSEIWSTKVMGHRVEYRESYSSGANTSVGGGRNSSQTDGTSTSEGTNWSHTDSTTESRTETDGTSEGESVEYSESESFTETEGTGHSVSASASLGSSRSDGESYSESEDESSSHSVSDGSNWGSGTRTSSSGSKGTSETHSNAFREYNEEKEREDDLITESEAENESSSWGSGTTDSHGGSRSVSDSDSESSGHSRGWNRGSSRDASISLGATDTESSSSAETHGTSRSEGRQTSRSHSESATKGISASDAAGGNSSRGASTARTVGESSSWSRGESKGVTRSPMLMPVMGKERSSVTFRSIDEQLFQFTQLLAAQKDRHCVVRLTGMANPQQVATATVKDGAATPQWAERWTAEKVKTLAFAVSMSDALKRIADREQGLVASLRGGDLASEPATARRRVQPRPRKS
jgi:hypothetical protein